MAFDEMKVDMLAELDQRLECLSGPSDYAFLLTIRGLVADWQFPFYTAMDFTLTKESYQKIISDLYMIKLTVLVSVCDMGMFQLHMHIHAIYTFCYLHMILTNYINTIYIYSSYL